MECGWDDLIPTFAFASFTDNEDSLTFLSGFLRDQTRGMSILTVLEWLAATRWSVALHESLYVWPLVESIHVLCLALFVGTVLMLDLRLLGVAMTRVPASAFTRQGSCRSRPGPQW